MFNGVNILELNKNIDSLKQNIKQIELEVSKQLSSTIYRGHKRTIATDVEDQIAIFLDNLCKNQCEIFLDPSIHINKTHRPDILIVNQGQCVAMIEVKVNMGWCRDARGCIDKLKNLHQLFYNQHHLTCKFSNSNTKKIIYDEDVQLFLVSLSSVNISPKKIQDNINYANKNNVNHYLLFDGGYDALQNRDINTFSELILDLIK